MIFETNACTGCRSCEMACSYHHRGVFSSSISSIQVLDRTKELGFALSLSDEDEDGCIACDGCKGLDEPLCVKYCNSLVRDELKGILERFWDIRRSK